MPRLAYRPFRLSLLLMCCLCGLASLAAPKPVLAWQPKRDIRRQIERLEAQWREAQLAGDVATMDKMLSDDYVGITMAGNVVTKVQQLNRIRSRNFVITRLDMEESKIKFVGRVAIATVRAKVEGINDAKPVNGQYRYTRVYEHLPSGAWKITHFEATRIR